MARMAMPAFWIAGYLPARCNGGSRQHAVALLAYREALHRGLFRPGCPRLDRLIGPACDQSAPRRERHRKGDRSISVDDLSDRARPGGSGGGAGNLEPVI